MKRLVTLTTILVAVVVVPVATATGGPGKFQTKLTGKGADTMHGKLDGSWTIDLSSRKGGKVKLTWDGHQAGGGKYVISGSTISLTPKKGGTCKTKGRYTFKVSGAKLKFTPIKDTCAVRRDVLTFGDWTEIG